MVFGSRMANNDWRALINGYDWRRGRFSEPLFCINGSLTAKAEPYNKSKPTVRKHVFKLTALAVAFSVISLSQTAVLSEVLTGEINKEDELLRLDRPATTKSNDNSASLRIERAIPVAPQRLTAGLVDTSAFAALGAAKDSASAGVIMPGQFAPIPANKFDLGADRGSRELLVAWERWHHQLSQAIYTRWSQYCDEPGRATVKLTVNSDRSMQVVMVQSSGDPRFDSNLLRAILSLNGNPGLTFPSQSTRQQVSLESDYIAGRDVHPGFSWVTDDYEKVKESY